MTVRQMVFFSMVDAALLMGAFFAFAALSHEPPIGYETYGFGSMTVSSPAFPMNGRVPVRHTCDGENVSPPISLRGVPKEASSVALIAEDPDMPFGGRTHWVVWNLPAGDIDIPAGALPAHAVQGTTGFGRRGYSGPCPPFGTHRFAIRAFALEGTPAIDAASDAATLDGYAAEHTVSRATYVGTYSRLIR